MSGQAITKNGTDGAVKAILVEVLKYLEAYIIIFLPEPGVHVARPLDAPALSTRRDTYVSGPTRRHISCIRQLGRTTGHHIRAASLVVALTT